MEPIEIVTIAPGAIIPLILILVIPQIFIVVHIMGIRRRLDQIYNETAFLVGRKIGMICREEIERIYKNDLDNQG